MTILHAYSAPQFTEHLRSVLNEANGQPNSVDIAVGYFYLSGFSEVADLLAARPGKVRILIGRTDRPTSQEIAAGYSPHEASEGFHSSQIRRDEVKATDETVENVGRNTATQPQRDDTEAGIKSLAQLIAEGKVDVRAYVKDRMHAKVYIGYTGLESAPGTAIIGSTNFSTAGFTGNTELNYPVTHGGDVEEVREWFGQLWGESEPVSEKIRNEFRKNWPFAEPEPYLIYLKALYELYGETLGEDLTVSTDPPVELTEYQLDAVAAGMAMLEKHQGCYIADVVGMGKTFIGAEIVRRLTIRERESGDPLIICPASLRQMWERTCDQFGLADAEVISRGKLTEANLSERPEPAETAPELRPSAYRRGTRVQEQQSETQSAPELLEGSQEATRSSSCQRHHRTSRPGTSSNSLNSSWIQTGTDCPRCTEAWVNIFPGTVPRQTQTG